MKKLLDKNKLFKVCSFSGGRSSALLTLLFMNQEMDENSEIIFCNTGFEHESTLQFVHDFETYFGIKITWLEYAGRYINPRVVDFCSASRLGEPFIKCCEDRKFLPNRAMRFCTSDLKIKLIKKYLKTKNIKHYNSFIGIRYDEPTRWMKLVNTPIKDVFQYSFLLYDYGIEKNDVNEFWSNAPFDLKIHSNLGNCSLCFNKGKGNLCSALRLAGNNKQIWMDLETKFGSTFSSRYSLRDLNNIAISQFEFPNSEMQDIDCTCTID